MQEMTIQYKTNGGHGTMRLNLDNCFPCSLARLRKLLKVPAAFLPPGRLGARLTA